MLSEVLLKMQQISKSFNKVKVLDKVNFELKEGEVHALVGGNGAGKSTLMKILTGVYIKDEGKIFIDGSQINIKEPNDAKNHGISIIFQEFSLVPTLSIAQNIFLKREPKNKRGFIDEKECIKRAKKLLQDLDIEIDPSEPINKFGVGYWQMVEIAKAISQNARILIMDEPTSSLTEKETNSLFKLINRLKKNGVSIIYISHRMEEIFRISDRITILRDGQNVTTATCDELTLEEVIQYIVGGELEQAFEWKERHYQLSEQPILKVRNLSSKQHNLNGINFDIYRGEILGIAGLMGSGRSEMVRAIFGIDPFDSGKIIINGKERNISSPKDAINAGIALIPEDRRIQGLVLEHSVKDNTLLPILKRIKQKLFINDKQGREITKEFVEKLSIKTDSIYKETRLLSGGNQQKVVLAKWLASAPEILLMDEPTIGVDIGAKTEIIELIRALANNNKAVLVISSELPELLAVSDRIIILKDGKVTKELSRKEIRSEEELQHAIQSV